MQKHCIFTILVIFLFSAISPARAESPMLATFTNLSAQADPHTGSAGFAIPIQVVPGRGGIQPNLALQYNSSLPNGMLGVGWSLELGVIRRSTKDGVPAYNNSTDSFFLIQNGSAQELVYDSAAGFYRSKIEGAFLRVQFSSGYWTVRDRSNIQYVFGETAASQEYKTGDPSKVSAWHLNKVIDPHGNTMTITYLRDNDILYPQLIEYTSNPGQSLAAFAKVEFVYEDTRPDKDAVKYSLGYPTKLIKRLKKILVKAADTLQRRYDLSYTTSSLTGRSLLSSVTQFGNTEQTTLPPVTFTYQNEALNFNMASLPGTLPSGNKLWVARMANNYDRGHEVYGPVPPYSGGDKGFYGLNWSAPSTASSGSWGGDGSWSINPYGSLTVNVKKDHAYHFTTYVYLATAQTLNVQSSPWLDPNGVIGVWINGNYSQNAGSSWALQAGLNLIDITLYHQHEDFTFNMNFNLAGSVQVMNSVAPVGAQLTGDFNADTMGDLARVDSATGKLKVALSDCLNFLPETDWLSGIGTSDKVVLGDFNSDGRTDVVVYRVATSNWEMYFSNGTSLTSQGTWATGFGANGQYSAIEYNGDGRADVLVIHNDGVNTWVEIGINTGSSFNITQVNDFNIGTPTAIPTAGDFNGDGLIDFALFEKAGGSWTIKTHPGLINQPFNVWTAVSGFGTNFDPVTADFTGDGITDIGYYKNTTGQIIYRPGTGGGFATDQTLPLTSNITINGAQVMPVDINGDTRLDVIISNPVTLEDQIAYSNSKTPDLLDTIANGIGGLTDITYGPAHVCNCSYLPFPIQVVTSVAISNGLGSVYTTVYEYMQAIWDVEDREFRGFSLSRVIDPDGNYVETDYLTDDIYKGRVSQQRTYDADQHLFGKTVYAWDKQTIATGVDFVYLKRKDNYVYDGDATGRRTAEEYFYAENPQYGNLTKVVQLGEVNLTTGNDTGTDSRTVETSYVKNTGGTTWIPGVPNVVTVKNHVQAEMRKTWFYYDGSSDNNAAPVKGLLTKKIEDGTGSADPVIQYAYDAAGNLVTTTDPLNRVTSVSYDAAYKLFPLSTVNALNHQVVNQYYGVNGVAQNSGDGFKGLWGQLKSTTDPNNKVGRSVYDEFGRPVISISPLDSLTYPTLTTSYENGGSYSSVTSRQRIKSGQPQTLDAVQVYDGLGRLVFNKQKSETVGTYVVSGLTQYNVRGLPEKQYLPRLTTNPYEAIDPAWPHTTTEYDAMGRTVKVTAPDNTYATVAYNDWTTISTDANGHKTESDYDAYGRMIVKREYLGADGRFPSAYPASAYTLYATTQYGYDSEGSLLQTTDAAGNITTIAYDKLGRKISMDDPDMNVWSYQYDLNGNLTKQTDAKNQVIDFTYDALNRLVNKTDHAGVDVDYTYDDVNTSNSKGRLSYVQYGSGNDQTAFAYDALGRETSSSKSIGSGAYDVLRAYDDLNRVTGIEYPDGQNVFYGYNAAGQIETVANDAALVGEQNPWPSTDPVLLLHADGADGSTLFVDSSSLPKSVTAVGNAQVDTAQFKFPTASALFDGAGDYLSVPDNADFDFGTADFTIDFWVRFNSVGSIAGLLTHRQDATHFWQLDYHPVESFLGFHIEDVCYLNVIWNPQVNTWYHVALVRSGVSNWYVFINGVKQTLNHIEGASHPFGDYAASLQVGANDMQSVYLNGWMDEVRITKGAALWTSNFTPPSQPGQ